MTSLFASRAVIALVCATVLGYSEVPSKGQAHRVREGRVNIAENECFPKGGLGIINKDLYIDLKSKNNELILKDGKRWVGAATPTKQPVFAWGSTVINGASVPGDFTLENSALVSFEGDKVYFLDFKSGIGGFYWRKSE